MEISFIYKDNSIVLFYDDDGYLDYAINKRDNTNYTILSKIYGCGYKINKENFISLGDSNVCDARYVKIIELNIFVPRYIFIVDNKNN